MKLKATKYLLPTTDGRLHKELSYLISLHENKINKGKLENRISDLDNRVNELSHKIEQLQVVNRKELPFSKANIKPIESTQELFNTPTHDPITSTTLKTPNEWLKLMSEEERKQWEENTENADKDKYSINMDKRYDFFDFIAKPFNWSTSPQGDTYWENLSNRYNN
jgi:hypothetical protein